MASRSLVAPTTPVGLTTVMVWMIFVGTLMLQPADGVLGDPYCNISACFNFSSESSLASGSMSSYIVVAPTQNYAPYNDCMARAGNTLAFQCRCTLQLQQCLYDARYGNCSLAFDDAFDACSEFVMWQGMGCSNALCDGVGGPLASLLSVALIAIMSVFVTTCI